MARSVLGREGPVFKPVVILVETWAVRYPVERLSADPLSWVAAWRS